MSDSSQGEGWWIASDGKWYPPQPPTPPAPGWQPTGPLTPPPSRPWYRKGWGIGAIAVGVVLALAALGAVLAEDDDTGDDQSVDATDPDTTESDPPESVNDTTPEPEVAVEEGTYGSDPDLDALQDRCADGDDTACDDLFMDSPFGSEYEEFAQDHGGGAGDDLDVEEMADTIFTMTWNEMDATEQEEFCSGYNSVGVDTAYEFFTVGWGDETGTEPPSVEKFEEFFSAKC